MQHRSDPDSLHQDLADRVFRGKGELARLCREKEWVDTPLGAIASWPSSLRTIAGLVVASPLPMIVLWGPELVQIYNDGYRELMGKKHPAGLGQPTRQCRPEVWEFNAPLYEGVINRGETFTLHDRYLAVERGAPSNEACFTFRYSPAFDDEGEVGGVLVTASETASVETVYSESEERLRIALEAADLGTWDLDLTNDTAPTRSLRHDQIFGYEEHQAEWGQEIAMRHVLPEDRHVFREAFARAMQTGKLSFEARVRWPDGSIHWISALGRTYYDGEGCPVRMAGVVADITDRNRAEALRQSEQRFRLMANAVPQIVWITDPEGRVEFFNQQWTNYTGLTYQPETAAEVAAEVVHPEDVALTIERFEQAKRCSGTFLVEHRIRSAAGDYRWFLVRGEPYRDPGSGQISRWFGASVDIHDRKQAEEALRLHAARQAFQLALADRIRTLAHPEEVTAAASELLGEYLRAKRVIYGEVDESGEIVGMKGGWNDDTLAPMGGMLLRLDDFGPLIIDVLRAGQVLAVDDVNTNKHSAPYTDTYITNGVRSVLAIPLMKNGRLRAVLSVHDSVVHHWTDSDIAMANDMADRTWSAVESARARARLLIERDRSQSVFDGMTEGFALFDHDWKVLEMNAEGLRIAHRTRPQVIGKNHWEVWPETIGTEGEKMYRRVRETRIPDVLEYQQSFSNGHTAWIEVRAYPAGDGDLAVFFRDVTERKATEERLKEADRRKDEFLAMLSHELRNPLAPISAAAQLLQMAQLDEARVRHTSQIIGRQVGHMTHLINDLLDVSRVTRGLVKLETDPVDIRHIITEAVEQVTPLIQARRHHLALHLPPDTTMVMGDKKRLVQVLANVLNNAAKYTNEGGNILLKTDVREAHLLIEVVDDGIGMTRELTAHAFDLFAQAERSSDRSSGGLGLGLALVKSLVELHGGTVRCESEGMGKGSKFIICLPRIRESIKQAPQHPEQRLKNAMQALRILVVDDNEDAAATLAFLLEATGHEVLVEHESKRALERARIEAPDVCLLDIGLPEMDGNELAQHLRTQPETANSVLIAVTGYGQEEDRKNTLAAGFDHHLVKPVDSETLASILADVSKA